MHSHYFEDLNQISINNSKQNLRQHTPIKPRTRIPFTKEEDQLLLQLVHYFGANDKNNWHIISSYISGRSPRQCRERYQLFLSENVRKKAKWTKEEDEILISKYKMYGPHWKQMERFFVGRTSYNIKNRFISLSRRINLFTENEKNEENENQSSEILKIATKEKGIVQNANAPFNDDYSSVLNESDFDFELEMLPLLDGLEQYSIFD